MLRWFRGRDHFKGASSIVGETGENTDEEEDVEDINVGPEGNPGLFES